MGGRQTAVLEEARRRHRDLSRAVGFDLRTLREDAGVTLTATARAAGIDRAHLRRIELGERGASLEVLVAVSAALGARLSVKTFPDTGPRIRDRHQAAMLEALLTILHPRWRRLLEVGVHRPARGYIDAVIADPQVHLVVATEVQSDIRRLEQQFRWAADKAESLPSAASWSFLAPPDAPQPIVSRLLVLRSTAATRSLALEFRQLFSAAYPAPTADVYSAITTNAPWPGAGILWARVEGGRATFSARRHAASPWADDVSAGWRTGPWVHRTGPIRATRRSPTPTRLSSVTLGPDGGPWARALFRELGQELMLWTHSPGRANLRRGRG